MRPQGAKMTKQATPREVGSHAGLGPLPKTEYTLASGFAVSRMPGYSADQMRAYRIAAAAVAGPDGSALSEGLGAVLTYEDQGGPGACGQTIGADGRGWFSVLFYGTPDNAQRAAGEYLRALRASGRRIKSECVVTNEHSYSGPNVRAVVVGA